MSNIGKKGYLVMAMMMGAIAADPSVHSTFRETDVLRPKPRFNVTPKGLREYTIDGITVFALNFKNAVRKINRMKGEGK